MRHSRLNTKNGIIQGGSVMQVGLGFRDGFYYVAVYAQLKNDHYPHWYTCRKFLHQGDALLFEEYCRQGKIDPLQFVYTFNASRICTHFEFKNGKHKLTMKNEEEFATQ